jgi:hypothetical protein
MPNTRHHKVVTGETLGGIAKQYDVKTGALWKANPVITNPDLIHPGHILHIPDVVVIDPLPPPLPPPPPPPPDVIIINPGENIQPILIDADDGDQFFLRGGVHGRQTVDPRPRQVLFGEPGTVLDGDGVTKHAVKAGSNAPGVTLRGFEVIGYDSGRSNGALAIGTGGDWLIEDMDVHHNGSIGLVFNGPDTVVRRCNVHHNQALGIKGFHSGLVEDTEIAFNNPDDLTVSGWEGGGTKFLQTDGLTLRRCRVHDNNGNGLWCDHRNINTLYEDGWVYKNKGNGVFHEISFSAIIRRMEVWDNANRQIRNTSSPDVEIYDNIVTALGGQGGIYGADSDRVGPEFEIRNQHVYENNVTMGTGFTGLRDNKGTSRVWTPEANNRYDDNRYIVGGDKPFFWKGNTKHTWAEWQAFGNDVNGSLV